MAFKKILVAIDFSECSERALRKALWFGQHQGAHLTLIHVAPLASMVLGFDLYGMSLPVDLAVAEKQIAAEAQHMLERLAAQELPPGLAHELRVRHGDPTEELILEAGQGDYDLVVLGTHGRRGVSHALLGSVAERVLRRVEQPVLVTH